MKTKAHTDDPPADDGFEPLRVAVVGAGVAGAACAADLLRAGYDVTVFDKSRGVGGRLATRRAEWADASGQRHPVAFDHGCASFTATRPPFRSAVDRVIAAGGAARWQPIVHGVFPQRVHDVVVPTPDLPAFCRHLLAGVPLRLGRAVEGLERENGAWWLRSADDAVDGPFDRVVLAIPARQAASLLGEHDADWARALAVVPMSPCWTMMAVTDDLDWPWDAARIDRGELAWIARGDRAPGRAATAGSAGTVPWVAHASAAWSLAHLEDDPATVAELLGAALGRHLAGGAPIQWHHRSVHRWRYAVRAEPAQAGTDHWWCTAAGLGVCGDAVSSGSVEAAWCSGQGLARALMTSQDALPARAALLAAADADDTPWTAGDTPRLPHGRLPPAGGRVPQAALQGAR